MQLAYEVLHDVGKVCCCPCALFRIGELCTHSVPTVQREHYDKTGQVSRTPEEVFANGFAGGRSDSRIHSCFSCKTSWGDTIGILVQENFRTLSPRQTSQRQMSQSRSPLFNLQLLTVIHQVLRPGCDHGGRLAHQSSQQKAL